jgi:hypothetical protein
MGSASCLPLSGMSSGPTPPRPARSCSGRGSAHTHAHTQGGLPFAIDDVVVLRVRPDGRIEARWVAHDLCMTFHEWPWALERVPAVTAWLGLSSGFRVRP